MRTKIILVCLISNVWFTACELREDKLPEGIIDKVEMIEIITDVQMLEAAQKQLTVPAEMRSAMRDTTYQVVFNKYGIDSALFDSSLRVYAQHPKLMVEVMEEVASKINSKK
ncbi:DUF4296 domain-containing protein [Bacteroidia bacterium]|nr:DUF4296 domain-containing protein [Bacteroidia bacterium]